MKLFDSTLGLHGQALSLRSERMEVLSRNIANADTPNFKARDITFDSMFNNERRKLPLAVDNARHISGFATQGEADGLFYRNPNQPSLDGNTVDMQREQAEFAQNSLQFDTSFMFLDRKISGMKKALTGN